MRSRPDEGFGTFVVSVDVTSDGHYELFEITKGTAPQPVLREIAEEALARIAHKVRIPA